jgi:broad specificity phosphatase PhoE
MAQFPEGRRLHACLARVAAAVLILIAVAAADARAQTTVVILVRHAEKADDSRDAPLSEPGRRRAEALAAALADAGVQAVYATQYERTRDTAAPLARAAGVEPVILATAGDAAAHAAAVAAHIQAHDTGRTVLVVGHSNTVPAIIRALGGADVGTIGDDEYFHLFVVLLDGSGAGVVRATY